MYPPHIRISINVVNFLFVYVGLQAMESADPVRLTYLSLVGAITVQLLWLLIRVYDELKDVESDKVLAECGDVRFVNRPLVTGEVTIADISALRWSVVTCVFVLNIPFFSPWLSVGIIVAFGYITLS